MRVGLVQLNSGADRTANLSRIAALVKAGAAQGAEFLLLPEACTYRGPFRRDAVEDADGPSVTSLRELAASTGVAILVGGIWLESGDPTGRTTPACSLTRPGAWPLVTKRSISSGSTNRR